MIETGRTQNQLFSVRFCRVLRLACGILETGLTFSFTGSTPMGMATSASIRNFHRLRENALRDRQTQYQQNGRQGERQFQR